MDFYQNKIVHYTEALNKTNKKYNSISILRLFSIFICLYLGFYYIKTNEILYLITAFIFFIGFVFLMRFHSRLSFQKQLTAALLKINENEIIYLKREKVPFENGIEFNDFHHPYAYDLDIFGDHSLFQNLNRTATFIGKKTLANQLLSQLPNKIILENQEAVSELRSKIEWRQDFHALAAVSTDTKELYHYLIYWKSIKNNKLSKVLISASVALPVLFIGLLAAYFITSKTILLSYLTYVFIANLIVLGKSLKRIQSEIAKGDNIDK
ncbi:MAG: DNA mismatch repair protein, partial [Flavobacterium sp.]